MGKKSKKPSSAAPKSNADAASPALEAQASEEAVQAPSAPSSPEPSAGDRQPSMQELLSLKAQVSELQSALAERDAQIQSLKEQLGQKAPAGAGADPAVHAPVQASEEMLKLQERLKQLRKEQMAADAAKDAAWRQLKAVISDISKLATPAAGTPTGPAPAQPASSA